MEQLNINTDELEQVLKGTGITKNQFLAKLVNIKTDNYKTKRLLDENSKRKS